MTEVLKDYVLHPLRVAVSQSAPAGMGKKAAEQWRDGQYREAAAAAPQLRQKIEQVLQKHSGHLYEVYGISSKEFIHVRTTQAAMEEIKALDSRYSVMDDSGSGIERAIAQGGFMGSKKYHRLIVVEPSSSPGAIGENLLIAFAKEARAHLGNIKSPCEVAVPRTDEALISVSDQRAELEIKKLMATHPEVQERVLTA